MIRVLPPRNARPCPHAGKVITEDLRPFIYYGFLSRRESCRRPGAICNTARGKCCNTARENMLQHCARKYAATPLDKSDATSVASDNVTINYTGRLHITGWMEGRAATREGARVSRHHARPVLPGATRKSRPASQCLGQPRGTPHRSRGGGVVTVVALGSVRGPADATVTRRPETVQAPPGGHSRRTERALEHWRKAG